MTGEEILLLAGIQCCH